MEKIQKVVTYFKKEKVSLIITIVFLVACLLLNISITKSLVITIPVFTFIILFKKYYLLQRDYNKAVSKYKNTAFSVMTYISLCLALVAFTFTFKLILMNNIESDQYILYQYVNMVFVGGLNYSSIINLKQVYAFIKDDTIYLTKYVKLDDIIRVNYGVNRKRVIKTIIIIYKNVLDKDNYEAKEVYLGYDSKLDALLRENISKHKFAK